MIPILHKYQIQLIMTFLSVSKLNRFLSNNRRLSIYLILPSIIILTIYIFRYNELSQFLIPKSIDNSIEKFTNFTPDTALHSYEEWHAVQRNCMQKQTCNPPVIIWQCPHRDYSKCAGLGDRMRGLQFAFLLAIATKRVLLIDWPTKPFPLQTVVSPARVDWTMLNNYKSPHKTNLYLDWYSCIKSLPCGSPTSHRFPHFNHLPMRNASFPLANLSSTDIAPPSVDISKDDLRQIWLPYKVIRLTERLVPPAIQALQRNEHLKPYLGALEHYSLLDIQRLMTQTLFAPSKSVHHRMRKFFLTNKPYIGLHLRSGEDFNEIDHRFDIIKKNEKRTVINMLKCITALVSNKSAPFDQFSGKPLHVYIASDSKNLKSLFRKYGKQFKVRVHMMSQKTMHIEKTRRKDFNSNNAQLRTFRNVFVDIFMLSGGSVLLGTGSGFSNTSWAFSDSTDYFRIPVDEREESEGCKLSRISDKKRR